MKLFDLKGRTAVVVGGAGYLGHAISEVLLENGAEVIIASRDANKCRDTVVEFNKRFSNKSMTVPVDIGDLSSVRDFVTELNKTHSKIDILVNCAWSGKKNSLESISYEDWDYDINVCLTGVFRVTKELIPLLEKSKNGCILNIASMYGHVAPDYRLYEGTNYTNPPSYGAAKAGIIQFTRYLASFLAVHSIRANCISPGPFPFGETLKNEMFISRLSAKNMSNRIGKPDDIKGAALLLCSDAGAYINGQNIAVDGGWTSW